MSKAPEGIYRLALEVCRPITRGLTKATWKGQENFPKDRPFIVIMNHLSEFDAFVLMHFITDQGVAVRALAKASLFKVPLLGSLLRKTNMVEVHRGNERSKDALEAAKKAILAGESIALFPEGTLTTDPEFWPMHFKTGAARLALATGAPVIPIAHWGSQNVMHRFGNSIMKFWKRHATTVVAGPAIDLSDLPQDETDREAVATANRRMEDAIRSMLAQIRGEAVPTQIWNPKTQAYEPLETAGE
ncbi:1-acyl-sn-glycerol-3-phosphate acyltransferase [Gleimia sp. 6138-11-ORH1]|uniref:lysophospholipid acyltransferase family protein n=1 Tax=Gleimia sp. 6138-11-ORH1 TaxID=2973937 RepID=UPI002166D504|nr:lysophospholipid acyltransferase family protein [Gleimia sp. 6138-11-ORH1]MCS4484870.1 1-acyl-sn-glycerol-3-phosphate acyltransferase [Gleimia sp. 6138-11-ORH1]